MSLKISIVEDDHRVRASLEILVAGAPGFRCLSTHDSAENLLERLEELDPDVILMDIQLPRMSGIECVRKLRGVRPNVLVIMLTVFEDDDLIFQALAAGADGYVLKRTPPAEILEAITEVTQGGAPMSSSIARKVIRSFAENPSPDAAAAPELSARELEILDLLSRGYYYKEIAEMLSIHFETVHSHIRKIYGKLRVRTRADAIARYFELI